MSHESNEKRKYLTIKMKTWYMKQQYHNINHISNNVCRESAGFSSRWFLPVVFWLKQTTISFAYLTIWWYRQSGSNKFFNKRHSSRIQCYFCKKANTVAQLYQNKYDEFVSVSFFFLRWYDICCDRAWKLLLINNLSFTRSHIHYWCDIASIIRYDIRCVWWDDQIYITMYLFRSCKRYST